MTDENEIAIHAEAHSKLQDAVLLWIMACWLLYNLGSLGFVYYAPEPEELSISSTENTVIFVLSLISLMMIILASCWKQWFLCPCFGIFQLSMFAHGFKLGPVEF